MSLDSESRKAFDRLQCALNKSDAASDWIVEEFAKGTACHTLASAYVASASTFLTALLWSDFGNDLLRADVNDICDLIGKQLAFHLKDNIHELQRDDQRACDEATEMLRQVVERHADGKFH